MGVGARLVRGVIVVAAFTVVSGSAVVVSGTAGAQETSTAVSCSAKDFRLLLWPAGHPAIKSAGFPEYLVTHLEVYTGKGKKYPNSQSVGYLDLTGAGGSTDLCTPAASVPAPSGGTNKSQTKAVLLTCKLKTDAVVEFAAAERTVRLFQSGKQAAEASLGSKESSLEYDKKVCKTGKAPS